MRLLFHCWIDKRLKKFGLSWLKQLSLIQPAKKYQVKKARSVRVLFCSMYWGILTRCFVCKSDDHELRFLMSLIAAYSVWWITFITGFFILGPSIDDGYYIEFSINSMNGHGPGFWLGETFSPVFFVFPSNIFRQWGQYWLYSSIRLKTKSCSSVV